MLAYNQMHSLITANTYIHKDTLIAPLPLIIRMQNTEETHPKLKSRTISCIYYIHVVSLIILKYYTKHCIITGVLRVKFRNGWTTDK